MNGEAGNNSKDPVISVSEEDKKKAEETKEAANKLFKENKFDDAIEKYIEAIKLNPYVAAYYANRSIAYIKTEAYGYAAMDADKALEIDPSYIKGYYRRAAANMALCKFQDALRDFRTVVKKAPGDKDAKAKMVKCERIVKKMEFEKAIEVDSSKKNVADTIDISSMTVESPYEGPRMASDGITEGFINEMMEYFKDQKLIHKIFAYKIILAVREHMLKLPSLVDITIPEDSTLTVCGDVHGQYYDLLNIFKINGLPSEKNIYLFNGDFVDRGSFSVEIILTLFAYQWLYPNSLYLTRGNHETDDMNKVYGFEGEAKSKYSDVMFNLFAETFATLPLAHLINRKILVTHGGLFSRDNVTLDEIRQINRFKRKPESTGLMCELLWSDPQKSPGRSVSKRGVGIQFGPDVTENHEVKENGYVIEHDGKCITVFSAPNYCDTIGNKGALIRISPDLQLTYTTFEAVPHPNVRPMAYASQFGGLM
ncbi:649_t:CDS:10 [Ambispora gerdemannii]|uniref:protein-serine/threonine phosphatase n=1 Tax=Ambispora gerdemannii TaxID=144530 RepID=A0A9N9A315_9GLOM|nr:649_t:CDS:10 [Ambispora gerdemannii]